MNLVNKNFLLILGILAIVAPAKAEDSFAKNACLGNDISFREAGKLFRPGEDSVSMPYQLLERTRKCSSVSGCSAWRMSSGSIGSGGGTLTVRAFSDRLILKLLDDGRANPGGGNSYQMHCEDFGRGRSDPSCGDYWYRGSGYYGDVSRSMFRSKYVKFTGHCIQILGGNYEETYPEAPTKEYSILVNF